MQRPLSMLSDHSVASTNSVAGPSSGLRAQRQRPKLTGPRTRKPTAKSTLPNVSETAPQQTLPPLPTSLPLPTNASAYELVPARRDESQRVEEEDEEGRNRDSVLSKRPQSEQLPSYVQSQQQNSTPPRSFSPGPPSAVASDSSCAFPQRTAGTPPQPEASSIPALAMPSPIQTNSSIPFPGLQSESRGLRLYDSPVQSSTHLAPEDLSGTGPASESFTVASFPKSSTPTLRPGTPASIKSRTISTTPVHIQQPAPVDFSSIPIAWKALTLDAAQWTFSSSELQAIVSRAIRASAEPTSIRLLPLQTIDQELGEETQKLEAERMQEQANYRFTMQRRTMLLQSLNAVSNGLGGGSNSSVSPSVSTFSQSSVGQSSQSPGVELVHRLAEISMTLDAKTQNLLRISDQLFQIRQLQDIHAASALAVALRKLNASYARRVKEVHSLKEKLSAVEAERDEAWRFAEQLATEADADADEDFEDILTGDVVNVQRAVAAPATLTRASQVGVGIKIKTPGVGPRVRIPSASANEREGGDQALVDESAVDLDADADAGEQVFSPESAPDESRLSHTSTSIPRRRRVNSATSRVTAARTRSQRASKASLRFPMGRNQDHEGASETRPPSAYSQASSRGHSRQRSRSRAGSFSGPSSSPLDASTMSPAHAAGPVPDVPKIPDAAELSRLETAKAAEAAAKTFSPMTAGTGNGSFLDTLSRIGSAVDGKAEESVAPPTSQLMNGLDSNSTLNDDSVAPLIRPAIHPRPVSDSKVAALSPSTSEVTTAALRFRPSLQVYPPTWTRLPPIDSPKDVTRNSDPHRADDNESSEISEDEDELADEFEIAYARTLPQAVRLPRSPLKLQHTQSMLPFPRADTTHVKSVDDNIIVNSPQSDNVARSGDGSIYDSAQLKRPASLGGNPTTYL